MTPPAGEPPTKPAPGIRLVQFEAPAALARRLKTYASATGRTIKAVCVEAVEEYLRGKGAKEKGGGK